ncbi:MAG: chorismate synthase [Clostridiales bacterium]|nr:chorismate synthase [Clostridiales bacterium]
MSSEFGKAVKISIFGESHAAALGVVIDGLPAGESVDIESIKAFISRRSPSGDYSTSRRESDEPEILSGVFRGKTCGSPLCIMFRNTDARPDDYSDFEHVPRPSHADYTAHVRYGGFNDFRGAGHLSGRLTLPLCAAGAICRDILSRRGVNIGAHIASISDVNDEKFNSTDISEEVLGSLRASAFPLLNPTLEEKMRSRISAAHSAGDSLGGTIECAVTGFPCGVGSPLFDGIENRIASAVFAVPSVKGIEFGSGFAGSALTGSENNDAFLLHEGKIATRTNNSGGILGGISDGMPIVFRVALKPVPSIAVAQKTVDIENLRECEISIKGRHDACVVPRAVPCIEAAAAVTLLDMLICERN